MPRGVIWRSFRRPPWPLLFATAGFGLILVLGRAGQSGAMVALCANLGLNAPERLPELLRAALAFYQPLELLSDWVLMLLSMMPPLLAAPLMHVWRSSRPRKRMRVSAAFVLGYGTAWTVAGPALLGLALMFQLMAGQQALPAALLLALWWSASPWQRTALNRGHRLRPIGLLGWRAERDGLLYGGTHGMWCIGSCWAWMLVPLVGGAWHIPLMVLAGGVMLMERLARPAPASWRWPAVLALIRHRASPAGRVAGYRRG